VDLSILRDTLAHAQTDTIPSTSSILEKTTFVFKTNVLTDPMEQPKPKSQTGSNSNRIPVALTGSIALDTLTAGEIIDVKRIITGSNQTFLVRIDAGPGKYIQAIYKPEKGEQPLYDFPSGSLYKREYAAYIFSQSLGWPNIPVTTIRNGPHGIGSVQLFLDADPQITYFNLVCEQREELLSISVFDIAVNNADRKGGHCLLGRDQRIWSIDHGLTFHPVFKMRTVMQEFWGAPIPAPLIDDMRRVANELESKLGTAILLSKVLDESELNALHRRLESLLHDRIIPSFNSYANLPWPLV
jgi:uncharacterized repeat protein (TIGR03843 family)